MTPSPVTVIAAASDHLGDQEALPDLSGDTFQFPGDIAQVGIRPAKQMQQCVALLLGEAGRKAGLVLLSRNAQPRHQFFALQREPYPSDALVANIQPALDKTICSQLVEDGHQACSYKVETLCQLGLRQTRIGFD
jgi:hypothetical protein